MYNISTLIYHKVVRNKHIIVMPLNTRVWAIMYKDHVLKVDISGLWGVRSDFEVLLHISTIYVLCVSLW